MARSILPPATTVIAILLLSIALYRLTNGAPIIPDTAPPQSVATECQHYRTIWQIIWSCLLTVLACTWTAVHPNLPGPDEGPVRILWTKIKLVLVTLIAPEYTLLWALQQRSVAKCVAQEAKQTKLLGHWTEMHGFFIAMGGFVLEDRNGQPRFAVVPGHCNMEFEDFVFPHITEKQIKDKSKGDALSKTIVIGQLLWFLAHCIARGAKRLPVTELELATAAYAVITVFIYVVWWNKPLGVTCYVPISLAHGVAEDKFASREVDFGDRLLGFLVSMPSLQMTSRVGSFFSGVSDAITSNEVFRLNLTQEYIAGIVFGCIHCIAWNFPILSHAERLLWRVSSVIIAGYPSLSLIFAIWALSVEEFVNTPTGYILSLFALVVGPPIYAIARVILLVLPFIALRQLPADSYVAVQWTSFFPHIA